MLLAERGEFSLDDDLRLYIPELPDFGETITIRHIITHTSGFREFLNLLLMTGRRLDHGDYVDPSEIIQVVQHQPALQNPPGAEWNYNNTGYGLAAVIVERTSGQNFPDFMQGSIFKPLGMTQTLVRPTPEHIVKYRAEGYTQLPDGNYAEVGNLSGAIGAGGIYSTVADLQRWVENFSNPKVGSPEIFEEMMTSYVLKDGESTGYGFGFFIDEQGGLTRVHHGGADIAHRSMLAYYPGINAGITTLSNHAAFDGSIAFKLAEAFFSDDMDLEGKETTAGQEAQFDIESYDEQTFDELVGRYALDAMPDFILMFTREDNKLYIQATGQSKLEIIPTSETTFDLTQVNASLVFHRNAEGYVDSLTLNQGGERHATRLDTKAWEPMADELDIFTGRYFSAEIETFYSLTMKEDQLILQQRRMEQIDLTPAEVDSFSGGAFTLSFERDRSGRVIAFYLSNVRTRGVRFARQSLQDQGRY